MISSSLENRPGILVIADISGYTHFTRLHYTSLLHAEEIISELMDAIIQTAAFPLQVSRLEGDAVLMYVETTPGKEAAIARDVLIQVEQFFMAFNLCGRNLIACDAGCVCEACSEIGELRLKAVVHFGSFTQGTFKGVNELAGSDVELARKLLKAPLPEREHILFTNEFLALSTFKENPHYELRRLPVGDDIIPIYLYLPHIEINSLAMPKGSGPALSKRLNQHSFGRMLLNKPRAKYNNLPGDKMNLILYLLEGISSGINILRKIYSRALRRRSSQMLVKPVMLMLVEVNPLSGADQIEADRNLKNALNMARPPLILNKIEGSAAFFYAFAENDNFILAESLVRQAARMYAAFEETVQGRRTSAHFRVILHFGEVIFKQVGEFDEIAGIPVILIHRILQSTQASGSELWMTEIFSYYTADRNVETSSVISLSGLDDELLRIKPF